MKKREQVFITEVRNFYNRQGRHALPWRKTKDPYRILVSEIMLQQTQVDRVIPKYKAFIKQFPDVRTLARSSLGEVLRAWQGLGYNRRAKMLHECAKQIMNAGGRFPSTYKALKALRGVGPYTAAAIMAFAYNLPAPMIETNIRTVYLHHFFTKKENMTDAEILHLVEKTEDTKDPRRWYYALMDYGAYLKKEFGNQNTKSRHYSKQPSFKGSDREIRGALIRVLAERKSTKQVLYAQLPFKKSRIDKQLGKLLIEGLICNTKEIFHLP